MPHSVLLADDSVTIQKVVELTFLDRDFAVRSVNNGDEAVASLREGRPDLVIADIHMPGASGYEVCRQAKQLHPGLPVLLLVGTFEPFDDAEASACGSNGFLKKPFDSQELLRRVDELLRGSQVGGASAVAAVPAFSPVAPPPPVAEPAPAAPVAPAVRAEMVTPRPAAAAPAASAGAAVRTDVANPTEASVAQQITSEQIEKIAHRVVELIGEKVVREVAWEVIPDLAEVVIKDRLRELEEQVERL